jgi:hypothetical protein
MQKPNSSKPANQVQNEIRKLQNNKKMQVHRKSRQFQ